MAKKPDIIEPSVQIKTLKPVTLEFRTEGVPRVQLEPGKVVTVTPQMAKELTSTALAEYVGEPPTEAS